MKKIDAETIEYGLTDVEQVAERLAMLLPDCQIMTFAGPLGAGKTMLIRHILRQCGIGEPITSPTFTYLNIYRNNQGERFYHFDLYKIKNLDEFCEHGFDEYLYQPNSWVFIEWPEMVIPLLTHHACHVAIEYVGDQRRVRIE